MAVKHWIGGAAAVADVWTLTISLTWAAGDTITITCGGKSLILTVGSTATPTQVATELTAALNNTSATGPTALGTGYSATFGGQQLPTFAVFAATNPSAGVVVLTANSAGFPFTPLESVVTFGDGDAAFVHTTSATGPNFLSNSANYLNNSIPVTGDILYFDIDLAGENGGVDCLYDLDYFRTNTIGLAGVVITTDWTGRLGLPYQNANGYVEYLDRYFQMSSDPDAYIHIRPGALGNLTCGDVQIDLQDQSATDITVSAGRNPLFGAPSIYFAGADAATTTNQLVVTKGYVSVEPDDAGTGTTKYAAFEAISIGQVGGSVNDAIVTFGANHRMTALTSAVIHQSGAVTSFCSLSGETFKHYGGTWRVEQTQVFGTHEIYAGSSVYVANAGTVTLAELFGGTLDLRTGTGAVTFTSGPKMYAGSSFYDPAGRSASALHLVGCTISQLAALQLPSDKSYTLGAAAP